MSGIAGIYRGDRTPVTPESLREMMDAVAYRGPDGSDVWCDRFVGLGHQMLWTTPESLIEHLPLENAGLAITADARIDNRSELIAALAINHPAAEITDSDLILAAYAKWQSQCPEKLVGDFAFAIWDSQRQQMFCARDHMGIKPFCYHYRPEQLFAFASDAKALLSLREVAHRLNEAKVGDYLAGLFIDKASTFFEEIFHLPPASCATITAQEMQIETYWSLDPAKELMLGSDEEYAAALEELFTEAVRCRLRSAFPVGTHLSGGLDSSSVACVARKILPKDCPLHTFSNIFEETTECDERPFIDAVLEHSNFIPHFVSGDARGPLSDLDFVMRHYSGVVAAANHFLLLGLGKAAQQSGVRVVLDGSDGDTTISHGINYLSELAHQGNWERFACETRGLKQTMNCAPTQILYTYGFSHLEALSRSGKWITFIKQCQQLRRHLTISWRRLIVRHGLKPLVSKTVKQAWHKIRGIHNADRAVDSLLVINRDFAKRTGLEGRLHAKALVTLQRPETQRKSHQEGLESGVLNHAVGIIQDYSAAFNLETRSPFMDKRLIEFCLSLPPEQKLRHGWTRYVMRQAMKSILPDRIWRRPDKARMGSSVFYGLLYHDRRKMAQTIKHTVPLSSQYINVEAMKALYAKLSAREVKENAKDQTDLVMLCRGMMLAIWLEKESFTYSSKSSGFDEERDKEYKQLARAQCFRL